MATTTPTVGLRKPDPGDDVDVVLDIANNMQLLDDTITSLQGGGVSAEGRITMLVANGVTVGSETLATPLAVVVGGQMVVPYAPIADNGIVSVLLAVAGATGHVNTCQVGIWKVAAADGVPILDNPADAYYATYDRMAGAPHEVEEGSPWQVDLFNEVEPHANYEVFEETPGHHVIRVLSAGAYGIYVVPNWAD